MLREAGAAILALVAILFAGAARAQEPSNSLEAAALIRGALSDPAVQVSVQCGTVWDVGSALGQYTITASGITFNCPSRFGAEAHNFTYRPSRLGYENFWGVSREPIRNPIGLRLGHPEFNQVRIMSRGSIAGAASSEARAAFARFMAGWDYLAAPPTPADPAADTVFLERLRGIDANAEHAESMRRASLRAQALIDAEQFEAAAMAYNTGLQEFPDWSLGHYNLALLLARLDFYADAITSMRRFLYLAPNDPEARAAQDMIYQWEGLLAAQGGG